MCSKDQYSAVVGFWMDGITTTACEQIAKCLWLFHGVGIKMITEYTGI